MADFNYRINSLAKELNMKSKEIIELLANGGFPAKANHMAQLTEDEFSYILDTLTKNNQLTDINSYLRFETFIHVETEEKIKRREEAEKAAAEKAAAEKAAAEKAAAEKAAAEKAAAEKAAAEKAAAEKAAAEKAAAEKAAAEKAAAEKAAAEKAAAEKAAAEKAAAEKAAAEKAAAEKAAKAKAQKQASEHKDRFANPINFNKGPQKKETEKRKPDNRQTLPATQQFQKKNDSRDHEPVVVSEAAQNVFGYKSGVRVVDTRTSSVNLDKYDEKLDKYVSDINYDNQKQKLKKQAGKQQGQAGSKGSKNDVQGYKGGYKSLSKKNAHGKQPPVKQQLSISVPDEITVSALATKLKVTAAEVIKRLMMLGVMANVNQTIDFDTAEYIGTELGAIVTKEVVVTIEDKLFDNEEDKEEQLVERAPVVVVMGHVDHGKTSLLDKIRHTSVTAGEAGGITQHIGAYRVKINNKDITFLDTPGHEAFTAMRARGAMATDIAILVVAADDGIMPQTVEAINHAKAAGVDVVVAINKMDKPGANPEAIKQELTKYELVPEEWGGDTVCVPVSALTGRGIEDLLENVLIIAEMKQLKANPNRKAKGIVIEARLDKGKGPVATVLVQNGTLHTGDTVIAGTAVGHVRAMNDENGKTMKSAGPSVPVEIIGLSEVPTSGDEFNAVEDERMARELAEKRRAKSRQEMLSAGSKVSLDDLFAQIRDGVKELNIIVKADVVGSAEAVKSSLVKISNDEVKVNVIHCAAGGITEGDVTFASASNAIIVGFNVRPDKNAIDRAELLKVDIRTYRVIYDCIDEITAAMKGMLAPVYKEQLLGHAQVRQTIRVPNVGTIAGSYIQDGKVTRNSLIRVLRDGVVVFEDKISSLRRFKDDVREVTAGYECGIGLDKFNDIKENDILEAYEMVQVEQ